MAGIEDDLHEGFNKALFSINQGNPWISFYFKNLFIIKLIDFKLMIHPYKKNAKLVLSNGIVFWFSFGSSGTAVGEIVLILA